MSKRKGWKMPRTKITRANTKPLNMRVLAAYGSHRKSVRKGGSEKSSMKNDEGDHQFARGVFRSARRCGVRNAVTTKSPTHLEH